jgi:hypothetical protein
MTERTLAASPNLDARQRSGTSKETSPPSTQVNRILLKVFR